MPNQTNDAPPTSREIGVQPFVVMPLPQEMMRVAAQPIDRKPEYLVGQEVRVLNHVFDDGVTPLNLKGKRLKVVERFVGGMLTKQWMYRLADDHVVGDFKEEELDSRFSRS